jgi:hypothetical protein
MTRTGSLGSLSPVTPASLLASSSVSKSIHSNGNRYIIARIISVTHLEAFPPHRRSHREVCPHQIRHEDVRNALDLDTRIPDQKPRTGTHKSPHTSPAILRAQSHKSLLLMELKRCGKYNPSVVRRNHPHSIKNQVLTGQIAVRESQQSDQRKESNLLKTKWLLRQDSNLQPFG